MLIAGAPGSVARAQDDDPAVRSMIIVTGTLPPDAERTDGVVARKTSTGTKTATPITQVPQAISVITRAQLDQQAVRSVGDGLRYSPGVFADSRVGGVLESVFLRGFGGFAAAATSPQFVDGLPLLKGGNWATQVIDPWPLERIEVLRGPASILYGQASPGGIVNMVSKRPDDGASREITLTTGNRNRAELAFDLGGRLTQDGTWAYRLNGLARRADTQADFSKEQRIVLAPTLSWAPDARTSLTLFGFYQSDPANNFAGWLPAQGTALPNPAGRIPRSFFLGQPNFDGYDRQQYMLGYAFEHRFGEVWRLRQNLRYAHVDAHFEGVAGDYFAPFGATNSILARSASWSREHVDGMSLDNQAQASFGSGPLQHTLLIGLAYQGSTASTAASGFGAIPSINYLAPDYTQPFTAPPLAQRYHQTWNRVGIYAQDQIRIERWAFTIGGRQDWSAIKTKNHLTSTGAEQDDHVFTGRVGAVYLFDNGLAPYASYSTSFEPTLGTGYAGNAFQPTKARQAEVGVKYQPPGMNSFVSASGFHITQDNVSTTDPDHPFYSVQTASVRSRGIEIEGRASLSGNLDLIAAYTYLDTTVRKDSDPAILGKRLVAVPEQLASLWANHVFTNGALAGFNLGAGIRYIGKSAGDSDNSFSVPAATLFDATVRYDLGRARRDLKGWRATINVTNLLDKTYVASCFSAGGCFYGNGRIVTGSLGFRW
ncbi:TonB-dependent siderophore receptor [Sphingomonas morindae]|uniref:TonB-dependent siderophore receptor n=1 Tax=Sphingomonas morindae TaxID=1541170 RepID=A0ABY4XE80_9SPHN|nr:TonB-dependent siderophore receptor [Sphingomonas morindae]USI75225.1 TonB-dependent siderophore receptor [Sphingomonas morindae]